MLDKKNGLKEKKMLKRLLLCLSLCLVLSGGVLAFYLMNYEKVISGQVISDGTGSLEITHDFTTDWAMNITAGDLVYTDVLNISLDSHKEMIFNIDNEILFLDQTCDGEGDFIIEFINSSNDVIEDGANLWLFAYPNEYQNNEFTYSVTAKPFSCPVNITTSISMVEA